MRRTLANQLARYPVEVGDPDEIWTRHLLRIAQGVRERLAPGVLRRAHHGGRALWCWIPALVQRQAEEGRHLVSVVPPDDREFAHIMEALREAGTAASVVQTGAPVRTLRALPPGCLDLASACWPPGRPRGGAGDGLDEWMGVARRALAPGGSFVLCASRDGSPEAPLAELQEVLREEDPRYVVVPVDLPRDEEDLRVRLEGAGFGAVRVWREGLSLGFPDGASAVRHFLEMGGASVLGQGADPPAALRRKERLAARLAEAYGDLGHVVLTFEAVCGLGIVPGAER